MVHYRLYFLRAGRIVSARDLEAADDEAALALVRAEAEDGDCELWCGTRRVACLQAPLRSEG